MPARSKALTVTSWVLQVIAAAIFAQTLFFKFSGAPETRALFDVLGAEPWGRYAAGVGELVAVVLLLIPRTAAVGGLVAGAVITGAIGAHLTKLGISIDPQALGRPELAPLAGPTLFVMALVVLGASAGVVVIRRRELPVVGRLLSGPSPTGRA